MSSSSTTSPAGTALYPGANNTELCPLATFEGAPIYRDGAAPDQAEIADRIETYWRPYHDTLANALGRLRRQHGVAVLFDGHSIASVLPRFFEGTLTDLNLGTGGGSAADPELAARVEKVAASQAQYSSVLNGRFKGGYITRHYGRPADNIHAVQLELSWATYLEPVPPYRMLPERADPLTRDVLRPLIETLLDWAAAHAPPG
jgi:N-formylglutamate deformylase